MSRVLFECRMPSVMSPTGRAISRTLQSMAPVATYEVPIVGKNANARRLSRSPSALNFRYGYRSVHAIPARPIHRRGRPVSRQQSCCEISYLFRLEHACGQSLGSICVVCIDLFPVVEIVAPCVSCHVEQEDSHQRQCSIEPVDFSTFPEKECQCSQDRHCRCRKRPGPHRNDPLAERMFSHIVQIVQLKQEQI